MDYTFDLSPSVDAVSDRRRQLLARNRQTVAKRPIAALAPGVGHGERMARKKRAVVGHMLYANLNSLMPARSGGRQEKLFLAPSAVAGDYIVLRRSQFSLRKIIALGTAVDARVTAGAVPVTDILPIAAGAGRAD